MRGCICTRTGFCWRFPLRVAQPCVRVFKMGKAVATNLLLSKKQAATATPTNAVVHTASRRTTVLQVPPGKRPAFLTPTERVSVASLRSRADLHPAAPVDPVVPLLSVDELRKQIPPERSTNTLPAGRISYTPLGARAFISAGTGSPTVLFESGLGNGKDVWGSIFNEVSAVAHAVAYDRAGYGQSEMAHAPRDGYQLVRELRALLQAEDIKPPYVLVGHSLGGTIMKLFARTYPNEVAGVVLVDARHAEFAKRCKQKGVSKLLYQPPAFLFALARGAMRAEMAAVPLIMRQARKAGPFPPVPLIVLAQGDGISKWPERLSKVWAASQRNMVKMSRLGRIKICEDSGHNIPRDQPDMVVTAILSVVAAARYAEARAKR